MTLNAPIVLPVALASLLVVTGLAGGYEVVSVTDGGTLEGRVTYEGRVPVKRIIPTKDKAVCGEPRDQAEVRVGPDKGVQDAIVYLKSVTKGKAWGPAESVPVLDNKNCQFVPAIQVIRAGAIAIHNSDPVLHNTRAFYGRRTAFNVALPNAGNQVTQELPRPGMVRVECDAHGWMLAHVFVADSPYYALTGEDGGFRINDIPPGDYTLVATQNYTGDTETPVSVTGVEPQVLAIELKRK